MVLLKTSSLKIWKEVKNNIMISGKIRKILILQLCLLEVFLLMMLFKDDKNNCDVGYDNINLLVYSPDNTLLSPRIVKGDNLIVDTVNVDYELEDNEQFEKVKTEVVEVIEEEVVSEVVEDAGNFKVDVYNDYSNYVDDVDFTVAQSLVDYAKQFVGNPYVYGGNSLTNGTDCSGFTKLVYAFFGIDLPRVAYDQSYVGVEVPISQIQIGDLVLSGYEGKTHHVAIYIGDNKIVHALNANVGIVITDLYIMPITHVRRVL